MNNFLNFVAFIQSHIQPIFDVVAYLVAGASILVKMTPTLKDDAWLKPIIAFIGKYIALDKYGPKGEVK